MLGLLEPSRGEGCRTGKRRGPASPGDNTFPSPCQTPIHISTTPTTRARKGRSPRMIPSRRVWKPQSHWPIVDWLRFLEISAAKNAFRANAAVTPHLERISPHPQVRNHPISQQLQQPEAAKKNLPGRYRSEGYGNPSPTGRLLIGWGFWSQRAPRIAPRIYAAVPPHPGG